MASQKLAILFRMHDNLFCSDFMAQKVVAPKWGILYNDGHQREGEFCFRMTSNFSSTALPTQKLCSIILALQKSCHGAFSNLSATRI